MTPNNFGSQSFQPEIVVLGNGKYVIFYSRQRLMSIKHPMMVSIQKKRGVEFEDPKLNIKNVNMSYFCIQKVHENHKFYGSAISILEKKYSFIGGVGFETDYLYCLTIIFPAK